jgi:hypothetical protein
MSRHALPLVGLLGDGGAGGLAGGVAPPLAALALSVPSLLVGHQFLGLQASPAELAGWLRDLKQWHEARVRALGRRGMGGATSTIKHGPMVYDQAGRVATIDGQMVELSARELGLLEVLLQRAGRLVSKDQLVERLCEWGEEVSNNAIEVYIHRLRKKIEKGPIRIATVRGLGYCLEKIP